MKTLLGLVFFLFVSMPVQAQPPMIFSYLTGDLLSERDHEDFYQLCTLERLYEMIIQRRVRILQAFNSGRFSGRYEIEQYVRETNSPFDESQFKIRFARGQFTSVATGYLTSYEGAYYVSYRADGAELDFRVFPDANLNDCLKLE